MAFDAREATVNSIHQALFSDGVSCRQIIEAFLARIEIHNPKINAIISLSQTALEEADHIDDLIARGHTFGPLCGVPILLKDNFDAIGLPTTAGSLALRDAWPQRDADVVSALRQAGAIILGKTNMHELALEGLTVSSLGGQTLNPYDFNRTPGGSSGGSGAAVAASFAVMATGSDTVNSLRSPASANNLYSFRPTRGLISGAGVVPVSSTQDSVGMITRSLSDLAVSLTVMAGARLGQPECLSTEYIATQSLSSSSSLKSFRIGVLHGYLHSDVFLETSSVETAMSQVQHLLEIEDATVINIDRDSIPDADTVRSTMDVQMYEIRKLMDTYLASPQLKGKHPTTFADIFLPQSELIPVSDPNFLIVPSQYTYMRTALNNDITSPEYFTRKSLISKLTQMLSELFEKSALDAIIYPQQRNLVVPVGTPTQHGRNGILAAVTGYPVVCIPIGFSAPTSTAPIGVPMGMEILGTPMTETKLLEIARALDEKLRARKPPVTGGLAEPASVRRRYERVPEIVPGGLGSVDLDAYPPGVLREPEIG